MGLAVALGSLGLGDLGVDLRGGQALMAQEFLGDTDVGPVVQEMGSEGMSGLVVDTPRWR